MHPTSLAYRNPEVWEVVARAWGLNRFGETAPLRSRLGNGRLDLARGTELQRKRAGAFPKTVKLPRARRTIRATAGCLYWIVATGSGLSPCVSLVGWFSEAVLPAHARLIRPIGRASC